ncbi:MAG: hypothetical protein ACOZE5_06570 [Verrucomicrobiota bacterium]
MNIKATALSLATATALAFTPKPAVAGDNEAAFVGGLIGGAILGAALSDLDHDTRVVVASHRYHDHDRCDDGYWKRVEVRVWVPGYWVSERRHGHTHRYYVSGHYEIRTDRVWVAYDRHNRHDRYDRHDRRDYGYDRRDRYDRDYRR